MEHSDLILECPCGHQWVERVNLPMRIDAFMSRAKGWLVCPLCGTKSSKRTPILLLTGERYRQAAALGLLESTQTGAAC